LNVPINKLLPSAVVVHLHFSESCGPSRFANESKVLGNIPSIFWLGIVVIEQFLKEGPQKW